MDAGSLGWSSRASCDSPPGSGPIYAMLFCGEQLTPMYARFGFSEIEGTVSADQPSGAITMPMRSMWAPLAPGASWPAGDVQVLGEPF